MTTETLDADALARLDRAKAAAERAQAARHEAACATATAALLGRMLPCDRTVTNEFPIHGSGVVIADPYDGKQQHVTRVRIVTTTWADQSEPPFVNVEMYAVECTKSGEPNERRSRYWQHLPESMAETLDFTPLKAGEATVAMFPAGEQLEQVFEPAPDLVDVAERLAAADLSGEWRRWSFGEQAAYVLTGDHRRTDA